MVVDPELCDSCGITSRRMSIVLGVSLEAGTSALAVAGFVGQARFAAACLLADFIGSLDADCCHLERREKCRASNLRT